MQRHLENRPLRVWATKGLVGLLLCVIALGAPVPASGGEDQPVPVRDPRISFAAEPTRQALAVAGDDVYWVYLQAGCDPSPLEDPGDGLEDLCVFGPVDGERIDDFTATDPPDAPLVASFEFSAPSVPDLYAVGHPDGTIRIAVMGEGDYLIAGVEPDGSVMPLSAVQTPCETNVAFDRVEPLVWFACGPTSVNYETGAMTVHPGGGVMVAA